MSSSLIDQLLPRLLVRTRLGDFAIDPWVGTNLDLSSYGVQSYRFQVDPTTQHFTVVLSMYGYGDVVLDPWGSGSGDLSAYGITSYEVVYGPPQITNSLGANLMGFGAIALFAVGMFLYMRAR